MLNALDCQRTLPLYLQASLLPKAERGELVAKAIDVFPQFVRFPNTLEEVAALESIEECWFARHLLACFYYNKRSYKISHYFMATLRRDVAGVCRRLARVSDPCVE